MRLLITRSLEKCVSLKAKLEAKSFEVLFLPLIQISPPSDGGAGLKKAVLNLKKYDGLILTSVNAVEAVAKVVKKLPKNLQVFAVGPKTAMAASRQGWKVVQPKTSRGSAGLVEFFKGRCPGKRFLYPASSIADKKWIQSLKKKGAIVTVVEAYQTKPAASVKNRFQKIFRKKIDAVLFFSPSAVRHFVALGMEKNVVCIPFGPTTARALKKAGLKPAFVPTESSEVVFAKEIGNFFKIPAE
ncbi:MAG: uroporphyrinogen-III synthase [Deltaproteobacteria bacterium]|nr:uroporphyrinogen-III synthase [Deltaproteobacteria bacterium]